MVTVIRNDWRLIPASFKGVNRIRPFFIRRISSSTELFILGSFERLVTWIFTAVPFDITVNAISTEVGFAFDIPARLIFQLSYNI